MADGTQVCQAYVDMRNALKALSDKTVDASRQITLLQRAAVAGSLSESVQAKFGSNEVPVGDAAIAAANGTSTLANAADGTDNAKLDVVVDSAGATNTLLNRIVNGPARSALFSQSFRGALRVSQPPAIAAHDQPLRRALAPDQGSKTTEQSPSYIASVALLFPTEAATLFPIGQQIADQSTLLTYVVIATITLFIIALRWIGTQPDPEDGKGPPAFREIAIAVVSFLLWVGALKGYWPETQDSEMAKTGASLFGFVIIMWVALVPAFVRKPAPVSTP